MKMYGNYKKNPLPVLLFPVVVGGIGAAIGTAFLIRKFTERRVERGALPTAIGAGAGTIAGAVYGLQTRSSPTLYATFGGILGGVTGAVVTRLLRSDEEKAAESQILETLRDPGAAGAAAVEGAADAGWELITETGDTLYTAGKDTGQGVLEGAWNVITAPYDWLVGAA